MPLLEPISPYYIQRRFPHFSYIMAIEFLKNLKKKSMKNLISDELPILRDSSEGPKVNDMCQIAGWGVQQYGKVFIESVF